MAPKRKKSKGRKKRRKDQEAAPPEAAADDAGVPAEEDGADESDAHPADDAERADTPDADRPGHDADEGEPAPDGRVAAVIDVDEDLQDPAARAELIAKAAGLAAEDSDGDVGGEEAEATDEAEPSGEGDDDREGEEDDPTPLIGRDALIALSQFRDEGVATVPEELVLDLGETTDPDERDRLLAAALAHVEMQEAIYRVPTESTTTRRWKGRIASAVFALAVLLAVLPPDLLVPAGPEPLSDADRLRGIRTALLVQAEQIEAFRVRENRLPASLGEMDTALPDIRFVRSSNRLYQLVAYTASGEAILYDSAAPDSAFEDIESPLLSEDAS